MKKSSKFFAAALMALASMSVQATDFIVFDGTATSEDIPVCSRFMDWSPYTHQVIYPEAMLTDLQGQDITAVKYFVENENGSTLKDGMVSLYIGTTETANFTGYSVSYITDGLTKVAEMPMTAGVQEIEFTFDNAWNYAGGNIVIQTVIEADGSVYGSEATRFLGVEADAASACGNYAISAKDFGPKTAFVYDGGTPEPQVLRGDVDMDGKVGIADVTALIDYILGGDDTGISLEASDVDMDGKIGIADVTALIDYILSGSWE